MNYTSQTTLFREPGVCYVEEAIKPDQKGWVKYAGTYWSAQFYDPDCKETISPGQVVTVLGCRGNCLLVTLKENRPIQQRYGLSGHHQQLNGGWPVSQVMA